MTKKEKTVLSQRSFLSKKVFSLTAALALGTALSMSSCMDGDGPQDEPEDIAAMNDSTRGGNMVQGREAAIQAMIANGQTKEDATKACDQLELEVKQHQDSLAVAQTKDSLAVANHQAPAQNNGGTNTVYVHDNSNNALLWYMILSNNSRPTVYYSDNHGGYNRATSSGGASSSIAPTHLTANQGEYLRTTPAERSTAISNMISRNPSMKTVTVPHSYEASKGWTHTSSGSYHSSGSSGGHTFGG